jgi:DUF1680 family protein
MIATSQSFATGGWGPNESFSAPDSGELFASLNSTHRGFETPCGSYAHCKLTRYLLRVTRDARYGDSMERVLYNTVLGAKTLETDGKAFYYSDYHFGGRKVYFPDAWPCCSGTLPQVAADYRILTYFRDADGVFVNLYLPSTLRWTAGDGAQVSLTQTGNYPIDDRITLHLRSSRPSNLALRLRIPGWSSPSAPLIRINGEPVAAPIELGFATLRRTWQDGDRIEFRPTLTMRLEAIDSHHPGTVALVRGPLVLFALGGQQAGVTRQQLLSAERLPNQTSWRVATASGELLFSPFTTINDQVYNTYLNLS